MVRGELGGVGKPSVEQQGQEEGTGAGCEGQVLMEQAAPVRVVIKIKEPVMFSLRFVGKLRQEITSLCTPVQRREGLL